MTRLSRVHTVHTTGGSSPLQPLLRISCASIYCRLNLITLINTHYYYNLPRVDLYSSTFTQKQKTVISHAKRNIYLRVIYLTYHVKTDEVKPDRTLLETCTKLNSNSVSVSRSKSQPKKQKNKKGVSVGGVPQGLPGHLLSLPGGAMDDPPFLSLHLSLARLIQEFLSKTQLLRGQPATRAVVQVPINRLGSLNKERDSSNYPPQFIGDDA